MAINKIQKEGVPRRNRAKIYEIVEDSERYPAKYALSLARDRAGHKTKSFRHFSGGERFTNRALRRLGFKVERIGTTYEVMEDLIDCATGETTEAEFDPKNLEDARARVAKQIAIRRGQPKFRRKLLEAYARRCAISGSNAEEALEACHIVPYKGPKTNDPSNGLLLRADLHTLFDLGLITIEPETKIVCVDTRLKDTDYATFQGTRVRDPIAERFKPNKDALLEHLNASKG
jgi:hypothetical protein